MLIVDLKVGQKKLFQISHIKKINNNNIKTIFIKKETPINKILNLPKLIFNIYKYLRFSKNKFVIIEGASWIFYSFITIFFLKLMLHDCKIIYISHSIESEIRKKYSNKFIYFLTKFLENLVFKISNYSTSVSIKEKKYLNFIKKTIIFPNAININEKLTKKKSYQSYIIYSGSYLYKPNKEAIDFLNQKIMPVIIKNFLKSNLF